MRVRSAAIAILLFGVAGCGSAAAGEAAQEGPGAFDPRSRAVRIETTGCGFAADRTGSGVAVGNGLVLTVAHLVARADTIVASVGTGPGTPAVVTGVDLKRDLAVLRLPPDEIPPIEMSTVGRGARGVIVGGAVSGTIPLEVKGVMGITIEEVLGNEPHRRLGYEVMAATARGDSGAGAYDEHDRLIGIVFATSPDGRSTWLTGSVEIEDFLDSHPADGPSIVCDSQASRLELP